MRPKVYLKETSPYHQVPIADGSLGESRWSPGVVDDIFFSNFNHYDEQLHLYVESFLIPKRQELVSSLTLREFLFVLHHNIWHIGVDFMSSVK